MTRTKLASIYFSRNQIYNHRTNLKAAEDIHPAPNQNLADIYPHHQTTFKHNCICQKIFSLNLDCINLMKVKMSQGFGFL